MLRWMVNVHDDVHDDDVHVSGDGDGDCNGDGDAAVSPPVSSMGDMPVSLIMGGESSSSRAYVWRLDSATLVVRARTAVPHSVFISAATRPLALMRRGAGVVTLFVVIDVTPLSLVPLPPPRRDSRDVTFTTYGAFPPPTHTRGHASPVCSVLGTMRGLDVGTGAGFGLGLSLGDD